MSVDLIHTYERMGLAIICDSICSFKKGPSNYQVSKFIFAVAFKCCSFKCLFECKNCAPSLHEQYHTVRFTSKQLNTFPSIVLKVFHFLYFPSLVNKAASCKSERLKLDFQVLLRLLNSSIQILRSAYGFILEAYRVCWNNKFKNLA